MTVTHSNEILFNVIMIDWLRAQLSRALKQREPLIPDFVPSRIRVSSEIATPYSRVAAGDHDCQTTLIGVVQCKDIKGIMTTLLPLEFEVLEFRKNRKKEIYLQEQASGGRQSPDCLQPIPSDECCENACGGCKPKAVST
jgi:hypothetical protein